MLMKADDAMHTSNTNVDKLVDQYTDDLGRRISEAVAHGLFEIPVEIRCDNSEVIKRLLATLKEFGYVVSREPVAEEKGNESWKLRWR